MAQSYKTSRFRREGPFAFLSLNRPRARNAINGPMAQELADACEAIAEDDSIRAVILTGAGTSFFCGGSDPADMPPEGTRDPEAIEEFLATHSVASKLAALDRPVIAAIAGDCHGQGLELALACDIRIASSSARFSLPHLAQGLIPWDGGTQRLPRLVGRVAALELLLTAETIDAGEALRLGLVTRVVAPAKVPEEAQKVARQIADSAPTAVRYVKEAVHKGLDLSLAQGLNLEGDLYFILQTTEDHDEGIRSFFEKRKPVFKGK